MSPSELIADEQRPKHLSPSSASTFRQCPRRWRMRYIDKLPDPKGEAAVLGTFVHEILEDLLNLDSAERSLATAKKIAGRVWEETAIDEDFISLCLAEDEVKAFKWRAWRLIEKYFAIEDPKKVQVVEAEQTLAVEIDGVPFYGIVDLTERVGSGLRVVDYKTGKTPRARYVDDKLSQVWLYAAALAETDNEVSEVRLMYLTSGPIDRVVDTNEVSKAVITHRKTWDALCEAIVKNDFPHHVGPLCNWCPYLENCPEGAIEVQRRFGPRN